MLNNSGMSTEDILILTNLTLGQKVRHMRLAKGLRQVDLASKAGVSVEEVIGLEKDRYILPTRSKQILAILGFKNDDESD